MGPERASFHLGQNELEAVLFDVQHGAICFIEAFYRHIANQLIEVTGDPNMSAGDCVILHGIRLGDRPKSIPDIQHFTNRRDVANIQYSVRKLVKAGLIERAPRSAGRGTSYRVTAKGADMTERYVKARRELVAMIPLAPEVFVEDGQTAARILMVLTGLYDQITRTDSARWRVEEHQ